MKKFYATVTHTKTEGGYTILLDGRPVKTPLKRILLAVNEVMAEALVGEWAGQDQMIVPETMPLTQILSTRIDRVQDGRAAMNAMVLKYFDTDLLCYRTDHPPELAKAQQDEWDTWLAWFAGHFDVPALEVTTDLKALSHPVETHERVADYLRTLSDDHFTVLQLVTDLSGSLVMGLAFVEGQANAQQVFGVARVEERFKAALYNEEKYGADPGQVQKDKDTVRDLEAAQRFLSFI